MTPQEALKEIEKALMSLSLEERDCYQQGFSSEGLRLANIGAQIGKALRQLQNPWQPIASCPKEHGKDYRLWDADEGCEVITWFGNGEWCQEGNYTHWTNLLPPPTTGENDE